MDAVDTTRAMSIGERLLAGRTQKQAQKGEFTGRIECGGGYLLAFYRALDYREAREIGKRHSSVPDEIEQEIRMAADTLLASCIRCEAHVGDEVQELPPLGMTLAAALGMEDPETDRQVVLLLFPSTRAMMEQFVELENWSSGVNKAVDDEMGNSLRATA